MKNGATGDQEQRTANASQAHLQAGDADAVARGGKFVPKPDSGIVLNQSNDLILVKFHLRNINLLKNEAARPLFCRKALPREHCSGAAGALLVAP